MLLCAFPRAYAPARQRNVNSDEFASGTGLSAYRSIGRFRPMPQSARASPNPRRTDAELSPPGESNVPNHPGGGNQTADDNGLTIPTFLAARPS